MIVTIFHDVVFLIILFKLECFDTLRLAAGAGFFILMGPLRGVILRLNLQYFTLLRDVSGDMQQACLF